MYKEGGLKYTAGLPLINRHALIQNPPTHCDHMGDYCMLSLYLVVGRLVCWMTGPWCSVCIKEKVKYNVFVACLALHHRCASIRKQGMEKINLKLAKTFTTRIANKGGLLMLPTQYVFSTCMSLALYLTFPDHRMFADPFDLAVC